MFLNIHYLNSILIASNHNEFSIKVFFFFNLYLAKVHMRLKLYNTIYILILIIDYMYLNQPTSH